MRQIDKINTELCKLTSVVTKWKISDATKLFAFKLVFVLIFTYGKKFCIMIERVLSEVQVPERLFY